MSTPHHPPGNDTRRVRAALMNKVCGDEEMFALGTSVARVVQMASSDDHGAHQLAYYVLSDVALTQRILRLSNTVVYRTASGTAVTTVSRAISLLGFNTVKTAALAMLLVDALSNSAHAQSVRVELEAALCASLVGREMARSSSYQGAEEASIGALFKNLGPLLVASHEHARYREVNALVAAGKHNPGQASQEILGVSYDALTDAVLSEWKIPDVIQRSLAPLPSGVQKPASSRAEWMRQVVSFSMEVSRLMAHSSQPAGGADARALLVRFGGALNLDAGKFEDLLGAVQREMSGLLESMNMAPQAKPASASGLPNVLAMASMEDAEDAEAGCHPSGKPFNAAALLLAGVQDLTQMRASREARLDQLVLAALEILCTSMGFRFATMCLKDERSGQYRARVAFGEDDEARMAGFVFPAAHERDVFHLSMANDADLVIADARAPKIRELLPAWHLKLLPDTRSFLVLPLVLGRAQLGLVYADRDQPAPEGVPPDETSLIKAIKGQLLAALSPSA